MPATDAPVKPPHGAATPGSHTNLYWLIGVAIVLGLVGVSAWRFSAYIETVKTLQARETLAELGERASQAYAWNGQLCPSAIRAVPKSLADVKGKSYQPPANELVEAGFGCLGITRDTHISGREGRGGSVA